MVVMLIVALITIPHNGGDNIVAALMIMVIVTMVVIMVMVIITMRPISQHLCIIISTSYHGDDIRWQQLTVFVLTTHLKCFTKTFLLTKHETFDSIDYCQISKRISKKNFVFYSSANTSHVLGVHQDKSHYG
jgi:hypothetical protein